MRTSMAVVAGLFFLGAAVLITRPRKERTPERTVTVVHRDSAPVEKPAPVPESVPAVEKTPVVEEASPPKDIRMKPRRLGDWVLALPDDQFGTIRKSGKLDHYVSTIVIGYKKPEPGRTPEQNLEELGNFLARVNQRIREHNREE